MVAVSAGTAVSQDWESSRARWAGSRVGSSAFAEVVGASTRRMKLPTMWPCSHRAQLPLQSRAQARCQWGSPSNNRSVANWPQSVPRTWPGAQRHRVPARLSRPWPGWGSASLGGQGCPPTLRSTRLAPYTQPTAAQAVGSVAIAQAGEASGSLLPRSSPRQAHKGCADCAVARLRTRRLAGCCAERGWPSCCRTGATGARRTASPEGAASGPRMPVHPVRVGAPFADVVREPALAGRSVAAPDFVPDLVHSRRRRPVASIVHARLADIGRDSAMLLDARSYEVKALPGPPRAGDDIQVIQVCKQLLTRLQFSRCPLEAIMLAQRKKCGGQGRKVTA